MPVTNQPYHILVTRPIHQADQLIRLIEQQGWKAWQFPTLEIVPLNSDSVRQQLATIHHYHWLIFISANAVKFALDASRGKIDSFQGLFIAAVGKATERALLNAGLSVTLVPEHSFNTEGLLQTAEMSQVNGKSCLIVRGQGGLEKLATGLRERGATVDYLEVYCRRQPKYNKLDIADLLQQGVLDFITVTSAETLTNLCFMVDNKWHQQLKKIPLIVISQRIALLAKEYQFESIAVTDCPGDMAIIECVKKLKIK